MRAGSLAQRAGEAVDERADVLALGRGAHEPRADDHAVGARGGRLGGVLGRRDAEAERHRHVRVRTRALDHRGERVGSARRARRSCR